MSKTASSSASTRAKILTLRKQLQQLKLLRDGGSLGEQAHEQAAAPLERQLVDLVLAHPDVAAEAAATPVALQERSPAVSPGPSKLLVGSLLAGVLAMAAAGYAWTGSPGATRVDAAAAATPPPDGADSSAAEEQQFAAAVDKLAQRLKDQPDNAEGWAMLARSYARLGKHAEAVPAYVKAVALRGDDARLLTDYADTLAVSNGRSLLGEPLKLVERALQLDPKNPKALALAGTAAFDRRDLKEAVRYWETLASVLPADSDFVPQLQSSIDQAREQAGMPKGKPMQRPAPALAPLVAGAAAATAAAAAAAPAPAATGAAQPAAAGKLQGTVRLAPKLTAQAAPTDTVFIYARAAEGPRMPLAILRLQVKDLPLNFTLDDSTAMSAAMRLSLYPQVVVSARVSKTGQAAPTPGDLTGQSPRVDNTASGVVIEISEVLK